MKTSEKTAVLLLAVLFAAAWGFGYSDYEDIFDATYPLAAGGTVALENINGDVIIEVWDASEVRVQAVKSASSQDLLDRLKIDVDADGSSLRIDTIYPSNRRSAEDRHDYAESEKRRHMKVEYTLTIPRSAVVNDVDLVNGNLTVVGVEGGVDAETVNGDILVKEGAGDASLSTVNGSIELYVAHHDPGMSIDLESVNGELDLYLSGSAGADLRAETVNGRISNDFGIEVRKGKYVGASLKGAVGGGGSRVGLETVNGSINVHNW
jgi:DUF4097 and DUF4098 domain-containing protein YvlB